MIDKIVENLKNDNTPRTDFVNLMEKFNDPFLVLIGCILSLRTNDKTTYPATLRMLELGKTPYDFLNVKVEDLEKAIYPVGFYKNKDNRIYAKWISDRIQNEKSEIMQLYSYDFVKKGDVARMQLFMRNPVLYYVVNSLYENVILPIRRR